MDMQLVTKKLTEIHPYKRNPRKNEAAVAAVMESIQQCTYIAPIIVDEDDIILAGDTRYRALKRLKRKEAEVIVKAGLSEDQKRKYRLLDNKTNELAGWDLACWKVSWRAWTSAVWIWTGALEAGRKRRVRKKPATSPGPSSSTPSSTV